MKLNIISLPSPNVKHILSSENKSNINSKYYWKFKSKYIISLEIDGNIVDIEFGEGSADAYLQLLEETKKILD